MHEKKNAVLNMCWYKDLFLSLPCTTSFYRSWSLWGLWLCSKMSDTDRPPTLVSYFLTFQCWSLGEKRLRKCFLLPVADWWHHFDLGKVTWLDLTYSLNDRLYSFCWPVPIYFQTFANWQIWFTTFYQVLSVTQKMYGWKFVFILSNDGWHGLWMEHLFEVFKI